MFKIGEIGELRLESLEWWPERCSSPDLELGPSQSGQRSRAGNISQYM